MSDRPTPETNALISVGLENADRECVPADLARKLERERDGAREHLREIKEYGTEEINAAVELRQKLAQALVDLDNMQDQRDLAMKVIKRLEQERDAAREALENEMKWHHQTHKELIEAQCKLLDIEYDKLKS